VRPGDGSLLLEWPSLPKETPLHSFILEYGIEEGKYTEKRTIDGAQRTYTIRDLINSIPYYLRLTPISITGDQKKELAATLWGVPSAPLPGFHAAPSDPVPESIAGSLSGPTFASGIQRPHMSARTGSSPLPFALAGVIALLIASFYILHRRRVLQSAAFLQKMEKVYVQST
jgi:hypothetical protein